MLKTLMTLITLLSLFLGRLLWEQKVIDNSVVYKLQTYYTGGPAAPTVFDQLNAEEL